MSVIPATPLTIYAALPPEVNTARLVAGAGVEPMYQAAAGWEALAMSLELQADELAASVVALQSSWQGSGSDRAVQATTPMVAWLRATAIQAQTRAVQAVAQASAYTAAMATTPPLPEIAANHVTHATLEATNFLGVNAAPIGVNEADYFVRMWNQAADAMEAYRAETIVNTAFEPIPPPTPVAFPGVGETAAVGAVARNAALLPEATVREAAFAHATAEGGLHSAALTSGRAVSDADEVDRRTDARAEHVTQTLQTGTQAAAQLAALAGQLPQQAVQPLQQLAQPLQQLTQVFSHVGSGVQSGEAQVGLIGARPLSDHPLVGGSGAASGAGLVRAASLPGEGGTSIRTPLMASLLDRSSPEAVASRAAAGTGSPGFAPVDGMAGGPLAASGEKGQRGSGRPALKVPSPLRHAEDDDDW